MKSKKLFILAFVLALNSSSHAMIGGISGVTPLVWLGWMGMMTGFTDLAWNASGQPPVNHFVNPTYLIAGGFLLLDSQGSVYSLGLPTDQFMKSHRFISDEIVAFKKELEIFNEDLKQLEANATQDQLTEIFNERSEEFKSGLKKLISSGGLE